mmetsp:Transcript_110754/g.352832  ORF Transcript_110754/g.352832 Transcript_110754/m.352832 type:complete len:312 (-) Transcript_110754:721-1656(-)
MDGSAEEVLQVLHVVAAALVAVRALQHGRASSVHLSSVAPKLCPFRPAGREADWILRSFHSEHVRAAGVILADHVDDVPRAVELCGAVEMRVQLQVWDQVAEVLVGPIQAIVPIIPPGVVADEGGLGAEVFVVGRPRAPRDVGLARVVHPNLPPTAAGLVAAPVLAPSLREVLCVDLLRPLCLRRVPPVDPAHRIQIAVGGRIGDDVADVDARSDGFHLAKGEVVRELLRPEVRHHCVALHGLPTSRMPSENNAPHLRELVDVAQDQKHVVHYLKTVVERVRIFVGRGARAPIAPRLGAVPVQLGLVAQSV